MRDAVCEAAAVVAAAAAAAVGSGPERAVVGAQFVQPALEAMSEHSQARRALRTPLSAVVRATRRR